MKVEIKENKEHMVFREVSPGNAFIHGKDVYLKADSKNGLAINVETGEQKSFATETRIDPINAKFVIEFY